MDSLDTQKRDAQKRDTPQSWRYHFPLINAEHVVYLDNAATTQKPRDVINAITRYYTTTNANVHRGAHRLSDEATRQFEEARAKVAAFIHATSPREIVWTRGTTEAINLVAEAFAPTVLNAGNNIVISIMEHHSNIVPWQVACARADCELRAVDITPEGELDAEDLARKIDERTRIVAIAHASNALGTIHDVAGIAKLARAVDAYLVIDGAQAAAHIPIDVQAIDCDFYAFSGHKAFGPTGIGVLYGREALLDAMPPWQTGGEMIEQVRIEATTYADLPHKFEAGTPDISGAIALGTAIDYLAVEGRLARIAEHEEHLLAAATSALLQVEGARVIGTAQNKVPVLSFVLEGSHPHDIGTLLDQQGIAVRTGHHCTMPLMERLGLPGTVRASFSLYNDEQDVTRFIEALHKARSLL